MTVKKSVRYYWEKDDIGAGREVVYQDRGCWVVYVPGPDLADVADNKFRNGGFLLIDRSSFRSYCGPCTKEEMAGRFTAMGVAPAERYRNDEVIG